MSRRSLAAKRRWSLCALPSLPCAVLALSLAGLAPPAMAAELTYQQGQGVQVTSADGRERFGLSTRMALRHTSDFSGDSPLDPAHWRAETQVRTARLWLTGRQGDPSTTPRTIWGIQLAMGGKDAESDTPTPLFDAFFRLTLHRDLQLQAGQWLVPFDRSRTLRESALQLVDRPVAVRELTLDRDAGIALMSDDFMGMDGKLLYHAGVFGGEGRNRFATAGFPKGPLILARMEVRPQGSFDADSEGDLERRRELKLAVGVAGAYSWSSVRSRGTTGSEFAHGATVDYRWWAVDVVAKWRGASLLAELVERRQHGLSVAKGRSSGRGAVVQGGYLITPQLELAGRWSRLWPLAADGQLAADSPLQAQGGHEIGAGLNWYFAGHKQKLQLDGQHSWNAGSGTGLGGPRGAQVVRLAFDVTF